MKKNIYLLAGAFTVVAFLGCTTDDKTAGSSEGELTLLPILQEMNGTRALDDTFFETGSQIEVDLVKITSDGTTSDLTYTYRYGADRIFRGYPSGYVFTLDDSYIETLEARWPSTSERLASGIKTDQRELADYKAADWISGGLSSGQLVGIMPTDTPVPLVFNRENVLLDFELVGQNTTGLDIESLLIELHGAAGTAQAYWAYCGNPNGHAELIVEPGSSLLSPSNYLIGRIRVAGQGSDFTIIFPETEITFEKGYRYLITLTPQGYFMYAYIYIYGFAEAEEGIGIPFQQPDPDDNDSFRINTAAQLITMSYLMRHYNDGTTYVWTDQNYVVSDSLVLSAEEASQYIPVPSGDFTGTITDESGTPVDTVPVADGTILSIFE